MTWQIPPNADPAKRAIVILVTIAAFTFAILGLHNIILALFAMMVFIGSTSELWFSQKFNLNEKGAESKCGLSVTFIEWPNVKRVVPGKSDVLLSPFAKASRLDNFRGVRLQFASNEPEVLAKIGTLWRTDEGIVGTGTDTRGDGSDTSETRDQGEQI